MKPNFPHTVATEELAFYTSRYSFIKTKYPLPTALSPCLATAGEQQVEKTPGQCFAKIFLTYLAHQILY